MKFSRVLQFVRDRLIYVWIVSVCLWSTWWGWLILTTAGVIQDDDKVFSDHMAFYSAARLISEGRGTQMYDYDWLGYYQRELVGQDDGGFTLTAIRNPPYYFLLYLPTARLPYIASFWIWSIISLISMYWGFRALGVEKPWLAMAWATSFYPVYAAITFGQNSLLSFGIFCFVYWSLKHEKKFLAGFLAGLLSFKPTLLLGIWIWWLFDIRKYARCWLGMIAMGLLQLTIALIFVPNEFRVFLEKAGEIAAYSREFFYNHYTTRSFWGYLFGDNKQIGAILGIITSLILTILFYFFWRKQRSNMPIMFGAMIYFMLLISPHALIYEWSLTMITATILWQTFPANRDRWLILFVIPWVVFLIGTQSTKFQAEWFDGWAFHFSIPILVVMGILLAKEVNRLTSEKQGTPTDPATPDRSVDLQDQLA
jgi:alpha-1,2-mannosyltransferase